MPQCKKHERNQVPKVSCRLWREHLVTSIVAFRGIWKATTIGLARLARLRKLGRGTSSTSRGSDMPYLAPHFDYDVFMSYAHGVPGAVDPPLRRWSQALIDRLKADILSLFTEFDDLAIWDDRSIDPTAALTEELRNKVERAC